METASSRMWTQFAMSISINDNHYTLNTLAMRMSKVIWVWLVRFYVIIFLQKCFISLNSNYYYIHIIHTLYDFIYWKQKRNINESLPYLYYYDKLCASVFKDHSQMCLEIKLRQMTTELIWAQWKSSSGQNILRRMRSDSYFSNRYWWVNSEKGLYVFANDRTKIIVY